MQGKIKAHIGLGRFFALPICVCAVLLGCALGGSLSWISAMVALAAVFQMAYSHSFNTLLDYSWTGLDKGIEEERSRGKVYTHGQQAIAAGGMSPGGVLLNGIGYLALSFICVGIVVWQTGPVIWIFWGLATFVTFWYSWGKLHYQCELALGVGFGPLAVMMGMASQPNPDFLVAFLASIPIIILWGYGAETMDQWSDAEPNWPRGLRNFGALVWKNKVPLTSFVIWILCATYISQLFMIACNVLSPLTAITFITFIPFSFCLVYLESNQKVGIWWGLGGVNLYVILLMLGEVL